MERRRKKVQQLVVFSLIGLNVIMIVFLLFKNKSNHEKVLGMGNLIEALHFSPNQMKKFHHLAENHHKRFLILTQKKEVSNRNLYNSLKIENSNNIDQLLDIQMKNEKEIQKLHLSHFREIKDLCNAKQLKIYHSLIPQFNSVFNGRR